MERRSWENAAPPLKDPNRVPDPSTLRRWFHNLDSSRPAFSFLRPMLQPVAQWLASGEQHAFGSLRLSWPTSEGKPASSRRGRAAPAQERERGVRTAVTKNSRELDRVVGGYDTQLLVRHRPGVGPQAIDHRVLVRDFLCERGTLCEVLMQNLFQMCPVSNSAMLFFAMSVLPKADIHRFLNSPDMQFAENSRATYAGAGGR